MSDMLFEEMKAKGLLKCSNCRYMCDKNGVTLCHLNPPIPVEIDGKLHWAYPQITDPEAQWCGKERL